MIEGGNHPELGQFGDEPYAGTDSPYLAANVVWKDTDQPILPPYVIEKHRGVEVGYIGVVTDDTPILVSPGGIADVEFLDEAESLNRYAAELQAQASRRSSHWSTRAGTTTGSTRTRSPRKTSTPGATRCPGRSSTSTPTPPRPST